MIAGSAIWLAALAAAGPLDLNAATVEELDALGGLGPVKAHAIVQWRDSHGPCTELSELREVPGIGQATLAAIAPHLRCGPGPAPPVLVATDDDRAPAAIPEVIDVNTASAEELCHLPGIVPARAAVIVLNRERNGPFSSCDDLVRVEGIGPATVATFGDRCTAR